MLFIGHGAQKLFGWFGGKGFTAHEKLLEKLKVHPVRAWALISAAGEFFGGLGFALGLLTTFATTALLGSMLVAIIKVHWPKGLWNSNGGYEFPLVLAAVAFVIGLTGPGLFSLDQLFRLSFPEPVTYLASLAAMLITILGVLVTYPTLHQRMNHMD